MLLAPVIFLAMNGCAWRAYMSARTEGQVHPSMSFFLDPSKVLGRPVGPAAPLTLKEQSEEMDFWRDQGEYPAEMWLDPLDPFARYVVHYQAHFRSCFGDRPALRLRLTWNGWKATDFASIRTREGWSLERFPSVAPGLENGEAVAGSEGTKRLWIRVW